MNTIKALPKELHALEINYLKQRLAGMPAVRIKHINRGGMTIKTVFSEGHQHSITTSEGAALFSLLEERLKLEQELKLLQSAWDATYFESVPELPIPHPVQRTFVGYGGRASRDRHNLYF